MLKLGILSFEQNQGSLKISDRLQLLSLTLTVKIIAECNFQVGWPWKTKSGVSIAESSSAWGSEDQTSYQRFYFDNDRWFQIDSSKLWRIGY